MLRAIHQTMENALYYTLSTIAQTLAGALAVLVAFVLLRLSRLEDAIARGRADLQNHYPSNWERLWDALKVKGSEGLDKRDLGIVPHHENPLVRALYHEASMAWRTRPQIVRRLSVALGFTVGAISFCFVALPFTPKVACSPWASGTILFTAVGLGIICLCLYVWLINAMVRRPAE